MGLVVLTLGSKTYITVLSLWVWMEVEGFRDCWICIVEFESCWFLFLFRFVLAPKFDVSLDWKIQSLLTYTLRFAHATPSISWLLEVIVALSGGCFSISVIFSTSSVLMTLSPHQTTCTRFGKHWPPPHWLRHQKMFMWWMELFDFIMPNQTRH